MFEFGTTNCLNSDVITHVFRYSGIDWLSVTGLNDCFYLFSSFMCSSCRY